MSRLIGALVFAANPTPRNEVKVGIVAGLLLASPAGRTVPRPASRPAATPITA